MSWGMRYRRVRHSNRRMDLIMPRWWKMGPVKGTTRAPNLRVE